MCKVVQLLFNKTQGIDTEIPRRITPEFFLSQSNNQTNMLKYEWMLVAGLSVPALVILLWLRLVRNEMAAERKTKQE